MKESESSKVKHPKLMQIIERAELVGEIILRKPLYICLIGSLIVIALVYIDIALCLSDPLRSTGNPFRAEVDLILLVSILLIVLPIIGILFLFIVPGRQKWLPWICIVALIWEYPIISWIMPIRPHWNSIELGIAMFLIGFALSIAMICLTVVCFVRNKNNSQKNSTQ